MLRPVPFLFLGRYLKREEGPHPLPIHLLALHSRHRSLILCSWHTDPPLIPLQSGLAQKAGCTPFQQTLTRKNLHDTTTPRHHDIQADAHICFTWSACSDHSRLSSRLFSSQARILTNFQLAVPSDSTQSPSITILLHSRLHFFLPFSLALLAGHCGAPSASDFEGSKTAFLPGAILRKQPRPNLAKRTLRPAKTSPKLASPQSCRQPTHAEYIDKLWCAQIHVVPLQ